jgi:hypothetical protein
VTESRFPWWYSGAFGEPGQGCPQLFCSVLRVSARRGASRWRTAWLEDGEGVVLVAVPGEVDTADGRAEQLACSRAPGAVTDGDRLFYSTQGGSQIGALRAVILDRR